MRPSPSSPVTLFERRRVVHLVRALVVAILTIVLTAAVLTRPHAPGDAAGPGVVARA